jgi:TolB protein
MRASLLVCILALSALPQGGRLGLFTESDDVGAPPLKGSAAYSADTKEYKVTGTGADIWATADQFHYLWREVRGDFSLAATTRFLTGGNPHRKASIMLRRTLDTDSPFLHLAIHGDGMPSVQFRSAKADDVRTLDFPIEGPGVFTLRLVRQGSTITFFVAKEGGPLRNLGNTTNSLGSPVMVGLGVASHSVDALNTVVFSDVSFEELPTTAPKK